MQNSENPQQPLVSIVIPVFNGSNYMREAIDSALAQTYPHIEVLVVNDGSRDGGATAEIARSYGDRIRYFEKENGGVSSALNLGIREMRGSYFSWLSHDDLYGPEKIARQVTLLRELDDDRAVAVCRTDFVDHETKVFRGPISKLETDQLLDWKQALAHLIDRGGLNGCALLIPRRAFEECGTFDESLRYIQDYKMWLSLFMHRYGMFRGAAVDVHSRVHAGQLTQKGQDLFQAENLRLGEEVIPMLAELSDQDHNFLYRYAGYCAKYDLPALCRKCLRVGKEQGLLSSGQRVRVQLRAIYGKLRPAVRKLYYTVKMRK